MQWEDRGACKVQSPHPPMKSLIFPFLLPVKIELQSLSLFFLLSQEKMANLGIPSVPYSLIKRLYTIGLTHPIYLARLLKYCFLKCTARKFNLPIPRDTPKFNRFYLSPYLFNIFCQFGSLVFVANRLKNTSRGWTSLSRVTWVTP